VEIPSNWYETFFDGITVDMWLQAVSEEQSEREADALQGLLNVNPGGAVLDVPCGGGRLSLALARRGYQVTGLDASAAFLAHARASDTGSLVRWEHRDMRTLSEAGRFDAAFCVGNSFGYLDDDGNEAFLRAVRRGLRPGARFVLETPMVLENILGHLQARPWWKVGDIHLLVENVYDASRSRLDIEYTFMRNGAVEVRRGTHRAYPYRELVMLLEQAGFAVATERPWTREAPMVTFIATAI
jgi:cyclopropane fatty-acyl-phospholipid synthase-like methyltransferase